MLHTYYLDAQHKPICFDCAQESLFNLVKQRNDTGSLITCSQCGEDVPFVGQTYTIRQDYHTLQQELGTASTFVHA